MLLACSIPFRVIGQPLHFAVVGVQNCVRRRRRHKIEMAAAAAEVKEVTLADEINAIRLALGAISDQHISDFNSDYSIILVNTGHPTRRTYVLSVAAHTAIQLGIFVKPLGGVASTQVDLDGPFHAVVVFDASTQLEIVNMLARVRKMANESVHQQQLKYNAQAK
jgi:hypothetical protein